MNDSFDLTGGLRYYNFNEDKEQIFDGIFAHDNTGTQVVSQPGLDGRRRLRAAPHPELQGRATRRS